MNTVPVIQCRVCASKRLDDGTRCENCGYYQNRNLIPVFECAWCKRPTLRDGNDPRKLTVCRCGRWPAMEDRRTKDGSFVDSIKSLINGSQYRMIGRTSPCPAIQ